MIFNLGRPTCYGLAPGLDLHIFSLKITNLSFLSVESKTTNDLPLKELQENGTKNTPQEMSTLPAKSSAEMEAQNESENESEESDKDFRLMSKGMSLAICYAANSGGISTLTGTGPNLILKENVDM